MSDIPADIMALAADAYLSAIYMTTSDEPAATVRMVARAILAERERCALIAEAVKDIQPDTKREEAHVIFGAGNDRAALIAAAIRKGGV